MFGFGNKKKEEDAAKAQQEQVSQAMRQMSDQIASKGKEIEDLQKQLDAAKKDASEGDAAEKLLAETQLKMREMQAEMAKMQMQAKLAEAQASKAAAEATAAVKSSVASSGGTVLGGPPTAHTLAVGGTAWVQKAGGQNLRLRDKPGLQSNAFDSLPPGTQMSLLEGPIQDDGYPWWRIRTTDGREGWVAGTELLTAPE